MTEDSSQLSVAELLARNGQQSGGSAGGGGRRRRSGRGISVAELTGDIPIVPGSSSHAAPDEDATAPEPAASESDYSDYSNFPNYADSSNFSDYSNYSAPAAPAQPDYSSYSVAEPEPAYSPLSGPISYYDPLAPAPQPPSLPEPSGQSWSAGLDWPPAETPPAPREGGRRRKPDPLDADISLDRLQSAEPAAPPAPREGGRRRRYDPEDDTTDEVRPFRGDTGAAQGDSGATRDAASDAMRDITARAGRDTAARTQFNPAVRPPFEDHTQFNPAAPAWSPEPEPEPLPRNPRPDRPAFEPPQAAAAPPMSRSARRHAEAQRQAAPELQPPNPPQFGERRGGVDHGAATGLPEWSARRRPGSDPESGRGDQAAVPTAAWSSLADDDQQLLSGQSVAGDLLRDAQQREDARAERDARNAGKRRGFGSRGRTAVAPEPEPDDHLTDFYEPLDDDEYDDYDDEPETSMGARFSALTQKASALTRKAGRGAAAKPARSRGARSADRSEEDEHRRQWLMIAGQSVGAAVAGMLLFKGFERMWEVLPWVALALAMVVILGLVALVRVLRRTDDIFSTVIAVVVGVFVTLGPLAFLLSTN